MTLRSLLRRLTATGLALAVSAAGVAVVAGQDSAEAGTRAMPGSFTGYAFDTCEAPTQAIMDVWREHSPFWGVGIYTSGVNRYCHEQPNLSDAWVSRQARNGWLLLPLHVGLQASCSTPTRWRKIDPTPDDGYAAARSQGREEAGEAVVAAERYGIGRGSTLWFDLEHFDVNREHCRESALSLLSAWTRALHERGYRSGVYSSASSGMRMLEQERLAPTGRTLPDQIWIADWNGRADTSTSYISDDGWRRARVHQYRGDHAATYGGVELHIDSNYLDTGRGSRAGAATPVCRRVRVDFPAYPQLERGDRGDHVKAAQCLLRRQGHYSGDLHGRFTAPTATAVRRFTARTEGLPTRSALSRRAWVALLAQGPAEVQKYGSAGDDVRRLQRALNAASSARLAVDGVFARSTQEAVRGYQRAVGLRSTGVAAGRVWELLQQGRR